MRTSPGLKLEIQNNTRDREYPGASDRMGTVADSTNFVLLLSDMRAYFDEKKPDWGISCKYIVSLVLHG